MWYKVLCARYGDEGGRLCFGGRVGLVWWENLKKICLGTGLLNEGWLVDNINREVGNGVSTLFWCDPWLDGVSLESKFRRLFELEENKLITVADMKLLGWGVNGEAWKWRRRLFAWKENLVRKCVDRLSNVILHVEMEDRWVWKLDLSKRYSVKSAYDNLTSIEVDFNVGSNHVLWL
jgi:hypothetical protein